MTAECNCGSQHQTGANYYVSVVDGPRYNVLAGPYTNHQDALADVDAVRAIAERVDPRAVFYGFGTVAMKPDFTKPGMLNDLLATHKTEVRQ